MPNIAALADPEPSAPRQAVNGGAHKWFTLRRLGATMLMSALAAGGAPSAHAAALEDAAARYRPYMIEDIGQSLAGAKALRERIAADDLAGAQKAWIEARAGWERSEVFTSGFVPDLDEKIDAWPNALTGFHAIEAKLFGARDIGVQQQTDALISDLSDLDAKVHDIPFDPQGLLNGIARLAYEVGDSKSDGGESPFSGTSLDDMRYNAYGIQSAYQVIFAATLAASDPALADAAQGQIAEMRALLEVPDLKSLDQDKLRTVSERLVVTLQSAAPKLGLRKPTLEEISQ